MFGASRTGSLSREYQLSADHAQKDESLKDCGQATDDKVSTSYTYSFPGDP